MEPMEISQLVRRCQEGDPLAWEELVRRYQGRIQALARGYVGDPEEARDLAQEIFVRIYRKLHRCRDPERFLAWTLSIARNACLDHLRRSRARPPRQDLPVETLPHLASDRPDPEALLHRENRRQLVQRGLRRVGARSREVLVLREIQGLAVAEVAGILGVPAGTVKSRASRARIELARVVRDLVRPTGSEDGA